MVPWSMGHKKARMLCKAMISMREWIEPLWMSPFYLHDNSPVWSGQKKNPPTDDAEGGSGDVGFNRSCDERRFAVRKGYSMDRKNHSEEWFLHERYFAL